MILTGERQALDPVFRAIHDFVDELVVASDAERVREISYIITLMALGDALLGVPLADALGLDPKADRQLALQQLVALRSEERRGGKEGVSACRSRWTPDQKKKNSEKKMH